MLETLNNPAPVASRPRYADEIARLDEIPYWRRRSMICHVMGYCGVSPEQLRDAIDSAMVAVAEEPRDVRERMKKYDGDSNVDPVALAEKYRIERDEIAARFDAHLASQGIPVY